MYIFRTITLLPMCAINILMVLTDAELNGTMSVQRVWWWKEMGVMSQKGLICFPVLSFT
jgi:hypothetical protein